MAQETHALFREALDSVRGVYDTLLTDGGANLSQAQLQMLTIAQAVVADPHMLILDEAMWTRAPRN